MLWFVPYKLCGRGGEGGGAPRRGSVKINPFVQYNGHVAVVHPAPLTPRPPPEGYCVFEKVCRDRGFIKVVKDLILTLIHTSLMHMIYIEVGGWRWEG